MIIDAAKTDPSKSEFRPFTNLAAIDALLGNMKVGQVVVVDSMRDCHGEEVTLPVFRAVLSVAKGDRSVATKKPKGPGLIQIVRMS